MTDYWSTISARYEGLKHKLANAPEIDVTNQNVWQKYRKEYPELIRYAEDWARLMQLELAKGKKLKDIAEDTAKEADCNGISGEAHWLATTVLAENWKYGQQLRMWHNKNYGGKKRRFRGIINPAIVVFGRY